MKNRKKLAVACEATLGFILGIGGTNAYLTSYDQVVNVVGMGKNTTNIVEEFPTPSPLPGDEDSELPKTVWVANGNVQGEEASVDCYVRVSLGFMRSLCRLPDLRITEVPGNFIGLKGWKNYEEKNKDSGRNSFFEHPGDIRRVWIFFGHFAGCELYLCGGYQDQCGRI